MIYKTTITIWTDFDPSGTSLPDLATDAYEGDSLCTKNNYVKIEELQQIPDNVIKFFGLQEDDD